MYTSSNGHKLSNGPLISSCCTNPQESSSLQCLCKTQGIYLKLSKRIRITWSTVILFQIKDWKFFHELRGRNIRLMNNGRTAARVESYNQGVVIGSKPLERDTIFEVGAFLEKNHHWRTPFTLTFHSKVMIDNLNTRWVSSLMVGVLCTPVTRSLLPVTAFGFKKDVWLVSADSVYHNGHKVSVARIHRKFPLPPILRTISVTD